MPSGYLTQYKTTDGTVPASERSGQGHMSTGSGQTITVAVAALRMVPQGVVDVLVPTLALLTQTVEAWRADGHTPPLSRCAASAPIRCWTRSMGGA
ncbi:hypothetical protein [Streptomyces sp. NPDC102282]|uniref:hypothetical protein n=1 Tax=Streptomyces sp. NPDC102282 TaxID=3366154 RepID=UPI003805A7B8